MDNVMKITLGVFTVILIGFISAFALNMYIGNAYRATLSGSFRYSTTITTDSPLYNVTLFIPVPEDSRGNSPIVSAFSSGNIKGIPPGWTSALFYTGKTTVEKFTATAVIPPTGTISGMPSSIAMGGNTSGKNHLETVNPVENGIVFRPVRNTRSITCPVTSPALAGPLQCYEYETSVYADYLSSPDATVSISSELAGENSWDVFGPHSNGYRNTIVTSMSGQNHGWTVAKGFIMSGMGMHDEPRAGV
jgi:hypothetical protein